MASAPAVVPRIKLGSQGLDVSAQGLGCMGMSAYYGAPKPEPDMIALIHHAVATGVTPRCSTPPTSTGHTPTRSSSARRCKAE